MKLVIQIPAYDEEQWLPTAVAALPRSVVGFDRVEVLVVDDGSCDRTVEVARAAGVDHIVQLPGHQGLARAFQAGLQASLALGADVIVNTDADNQYVAEDISVLVAPVIRGEADLVIGTRPLTTLPSVTPLKRLLNRIGSRVVSLIGQVPVRDVPSGFRAFSRSAAERLEVFTSYSYTLETLIQARGRGVRVAEVPIRVNEVDRPSRLMRSTTHYVVRSARSIVRAGLIHRPARTLSLLAIATACLATAVLMAWLVVAPGASARTASSILAIPAMLALAAVIADATALNVRISRHLRRKSPRAVLALPEGLIEFRTFSPAPLRESAAREVS